jgi:hypothetical protein
MMPSLLTLDLQLHHVAAGRGADHAGTDVIASLAKDPTLRGFS